MKISINLKMANSSEKVIKIETYSLLLWLDRQCNRVRVWKKRNVSALNLSNLLHFITLHSWYANEMKMAWMIHFLCFTTFFAIRSNFYITTIACISLPCDMFFQITSKQNKQTLKKIWFFLLFRVAALPSENIFF